MNAFFLAMASGAGMTSAIMNPLHEEELTGIMAADVLMNHDKDCRAWIRKFREPAAPGAEGAEGGRRERRRRRGRSEEHTSELQSLMRIAYAVFCLNKTKTTPARQLLP